MADTKTTAEAAASALGGTDLVRGVQTAANVKITIDQIKTYIIGALGAAVGTSLALGGATLGAHSLAVTGSSSLNGVYLTGGEAIYLTGVAGQSQLYAESASSITFATPARQMAVTGAGVTLKALGEFGWTSTADTRDANDLFLTRNAAAILHHGAADSDSPIAQTIGAQGSRAGTDTNVTGANLTIRAGIGTGNSADSLLIFQTPTAVASGFGAKTSTTRLTLSSAGVVVASGMAFKLGNAATTGLTAGALSALTNASIVVTDSAGQAYRIPCII